MKILLRLFGCVLGFAALAVTGALAQQPAFGFALNCATACDVFYWLQVAKFESGVIRSSKLTTRVLVEDGA